MSWLKSLMDGNVALSGWFPTILVFILGLLVSFVCYKIKKHKSQKKDSLENPKGSSSSQDTVISIVEFLVDDSVSLLSFNRNVYGKEDSVIEHLNYVSLQYIQKKSSYNTSLSDCAKCDVLNKKFASLMKMVSIKNEKKFDENFAGLYTASNWEDFLDEKFVEFASLNYKNSWKDEFSLAKIVENVLLKLKQSDWNGENDCSRVLEVFWNSLNQNLQYKIAIAYYNIYKDNIWRQMKFPQKQFADKIYKELGWENIIKEMMRPNLIDADSADIEKIAEKYCLSIERVKKYYDELHAQGKLDMGSFLA